MSDLSPECAPKRTFADHSPLSLLGFLVVGAFILALPVAVFGFLACGPQSVPSGNAGLLEKIHRPVIPSSALPFVSYTGKSPSAMACGTVLVCGRNRGVSPMNDNHQVTISSRKAAKKRRKPAKNPAMSSLARQYMEVQRLRQRISEVEAWQNARASA